MDVYGFHKGKTAHRTYTYIGHIGLITSIPCAVAALCELGDRFGDSPGRGLFPERLLPDPEPFLEELMRRGVEIFPMRTDWIERHIVHGDSIERGSALIPDVGETR